MRTFDGHFDILQEGVHFDIDAIDRPHDDGSILEFNGDSLVLQFHQESYQLHLYPLIIRVALAIYQNIQMQTITVVPPSGEELKKIEAEIAHYKEKYEVQQKRIDFLKRENEELKDRMDENGKTSEDIREQNQTLKKKNRELKSQLNELKVVMQCSNTSMGPKTATIKNVVVNAHTQEIDLPKSEVNDEDLQTIKEFYSIKSLILGENNISNFGLYTICSSFSELRKLFINHNQISDEGVVNLPKLKKLKCLDIRCNKISSESLTFISKLTALSQLSISNNSISDQHLELLQELKELKYLDITSNQITAKGGLAIGECKSLNNLYLSHNKINADCVRKLLEIEELTVLDVRFNEVQNQEKEGLRATKKEQLQLFL